MKLCTFVANQRQRVGAWTGRQIVDLNQAVALLPDGPPTLAGSVRDLLGQGQAGLDRAAEAVAFLADEGPVGQAGVAFDLDEVVLLPPVPNPSKILAIGLNYRDHCLEQGLAEPEVLTLFCKFPSAAIGAGQPIVLPPTSVTAKVDYEAELGVMIGKPARDVSVDRAYEYVAGYLCCNDVSARDVQAGDGGKQWVHAKSFDTFAPLGPWLVTADEVPDPHCLDISSRLNGQLMQSSNTSNLVFRVPELIAELTQSLTLLPGDIITTGTPGGVGQYRDPPVFLRAGDEITIAIGGLGKLTNPVVASPPPPS